MQSIFLLSNSSLFFHLKFQSLQNICEHHYESDFLAGQYEQPSCKICGFELKPNQNGIDLNYIIIDDIDSETVRKFESQFEFHYKDKSWKFNFGQSPRGIRFGDKRPELLIIKYQGLRLDKFRLSRYIEYLTELYTAME